MSMPPSKMPRVSGPQLNNIYIELAEIFRTAPLLFDSNCEEIRQKERINTLVWGVLPRDVQLKTRILSQFYRDTDPSKFFPSCIDLNLAQYFDPTTKSDKHSPHIYTTARRIAQISLMQFQDADPTLMKHVLILTNDENLCRSIIQKLSLEELQDLLVFNSDYYKNTLFVKELIKSDQAQRFDISYLFRLFSNTAHNNREAFEFFINSPLFERFLCLLDQPHNKWYYGRFAEETTRDYDDPNHLSQLLQSLAKKSLFYRANDSVFFEWFFTQTLTVFLQNKPEGLNILKSHPQLSTACKNHPEVLEKVLSLFLSPLSHNNPYSLLPNPMYAYSDEELEAFKERQLSLLEALTDPNIVFAPSSVAALKTTARHFNLSPTVISFIGILTQGISTSLQSLNSTASPL